MNSDSHFHIGSTHLVCQDYAMSTGSNVVLSDGCSGSVLTDFGSRILCVTAMCQLQNLDPNEEFSFQRCILTARPSARLLNIPYQSLDGTLLFISKNEKFITANAFGDGFIIFGTKDKHLYCIKIEYVCDVIGKSFPYYLNYLYDRKREEAWEQANSRNQINILHINPDGTTQNFVVDPEADFHICDDITLTIKAGFIQADILCQKQNQFDFVAIASDGLNTFYRRDSNGSNEIIPPEIMIYKLLGFKNFNGQFVKRRMQRFEEQNQKEGIRHMDDISLGVLYLGDNSECSH